MHSQSKIAHTILRIGLAFAFLYPAVAALYDADSWLGYFPQFIRELPLSPEILLGTFGLLELLIAVWILSGYKIRIPALLAAGILIAIVVFNTGTLDVVFRDISIAAMAVALVLWPHPYRVE